MPSAEPACLAPKLFAGQQALIVRCRQEKQMTKEEPNRWQMPGAKLTIPAPPPVYRSFADYLLRTSPAERQRRFVATAKRANRKRLLSAHPQTRVTAEHVRAIFMAARGRCHYCGSLAVERRPSDPTTGQPLAWAQIGRRIGSLAHIKGRFDGGDNETSNLTWACLWCNTWPLERCRGAWDYGGFHPQEKIASR
jgi:hypothetical protein